jgi:hypothetical protein
MRTAQLSLGRLGYSGNNPVNAPFHQTWIFRFRHNPYQRLGSGFSDQQSAKPGQVALCLIDHRLNLPICKWVQFRCESNIPEQLWYGYKLLRQSAGRLAHLNHLREEMKACH